MMGNHSRKLQFFEAIKKYQKLQTLESRGKAEVVGSVSMPSVEQHNTASSDN